MTTTDQERELLDVLFHHDVDDPDELGKALDFYLDRENEELRKDMEALEGHARDLADALDDLWDRPIRQNAVVYQVHLRQAREALATLKAHLGRG